MAMYSEAAKSSDAAIATAGAKLRDQLQAAINLAAENKRKAAAISEGYAGSSETSVDPAAVFVGGLVALLAISVVAIAASGHTNSNSNFALQQYEAEEARKREAKSYHDLGCVSAVVGSMGLNIPSNCP
jgi:hypothetical protein